MKKAEHGAGRYENLKRVSAVGFAIIVIWIGLFGGYVFIASGDPAGWLGIAVGLAILFAPLTRPFKRYWSLEITTRIFPAIVFIANLVLILIYGIIATIYLSDPFLSYNDTDSLMAVLFSISALLSSLVLISNFIAYLMDRRATPTSDRTLV